MNDKMLETLRKAGNTARKTPKLNLEEVHIVWADQVKPTETATRRVTFYLKPSEYKEFKKMIGKEHFSGSVRNAVLYYMKNRNGK